MFVLVVERIQYFPPKEVVTVRFRPRTLRLRLGALDRRRKSRFLSISSICLDDATLFRFIDCLIGHGEEFFGPGDILGVKCLHKRLRGVTERVHAAQVEHALPAGRADCFLCRAGDCHKVRL